jgi:hypothetical protein
MGKNSKGGSTGSMGGTTTLLKIALISLQIQTQQRLIFLISHCHQHQNILGQ